MFIYLDESYNLKDRDKLQFISINGFAVLDIKSLFKKWKERRRDFLSKRRHVHASDSRFALLRQEALKVIGRPDVILLTVFQIVQQVPPEPSSKYFRQGKLDFEKIYGEMLKHLFIQLRLGEYKEVKIILDSRKHKNGLLGKKEFQKEMGYFLRQTFSKTKSEFKPQPSSSDILLELADFLSNTFYRAYSRDDQEFFEQLRGKLLQIKNPL